MINKAFQKSLFFRLLNIAILAVFFVTSIMSAQGLAQVNMPVPALVPAGQILQLSAPLNPVVLRGLKVDVNNPLQFDFIVDSGDTSQEEGLQDQSNTLIKYFLASLTTPADDLWVNLSPYEKDRIIPDSFGQTEMGRDLLAQDYLLKQLTASLMYPEGELGQKFWERIRQTDAGSLMLDARSEIQDLGSSIKDLTSMFNKVWIVPSKAVVYERDQVAYVGEVEFKVMLENDYLAYSEQRIADSSVQQSADNSLNANRYTPNAEIIREVIIPALEQEVNQGQHFAKLRQIQHSLILATWYKQKLKDSLLTQVYADQNKTKGIDIANPQEQIQGIYDQYTEAFKQGVYDYIKEEYDPATQQIIPRKYFSGGIDEAALKETISVQDLAAMTNKDDFMQGEPYGAQVRLDSAVLSKAKKQHIYDRLEYFIHDIKSKHAVVEVSIPRIAEDIIAGFDDEYQDFRDSYGNLISIRDGMHKTIEKRGDVKFISDRRYTNLEKTYKELLANLELIRSQSLKNLVNQKKIQLQSKQNIIRIKKMVDEIYFILGSVLNDELIIRSFMAEDLFPSSQNILPQQREGLKIYKKIKGDNFEVQGDKVYLKRVLDNLLKNAAQAIYDNDSKERNITITMRKMGRRYYEIRMKDTGAGIVNTRLSKIFNRGESSNGVGHGLGLPFVADVVKKHNGQIRVRSSLGKGAEFIITLPRKKEDIERNGADFKITYESMDAAGLSEAVEEDVSDSWMLTEDRERMAALERDLEKRTGDVEEKKEAVAQFRRFLKDVHEGQAVVDGEGRLIGQNMMALLHEDMTETHMQQWALAHYKDDVYANRLRALIILTSFFHDDVLGNTLTAFGQSLVFVNGVTEQQTKEFKQLSSKVNNSLSQLTYNRFSTVNLKDGFQKLQALIEEVHAVDLPQLRETFGEEFFNINKIFDEYFLKIENVFTEFNEQLSHLDPASLSDEDVQRILGMDDPVINGLQKHLDSPVRKATNEGLIVPKVWSGLDKQINIVQEIRGVIAEAIKDVQDPSGADLDPRKVIIQIPSSLEQLRYDNGKVFWRAVRDIDIDLFLPYGWQGVSITRGNKSVRLPAYLKERLVDYENKLGMSEGKKLDLNIIELTPSTFLEYIEDGKLKFHWAYLFLPQNLYYGDVEHLENYIKQRVKDVGINDYWKAVLKGYAMVYSEAEDYFEERDYDKVLKRLLIAAHFRQDKEAIKDIRNRMMQRYGEAKHVRFSREFVRKYLDHAKPPYDIQWTTEQADSANLKKEDVDQVTWSVWQEILDLFEHGHFKAQQLDRNWYEEKLKNKKVTVSLLRKIKREIDEDINWVDEKNRIKEGLIKYKGDIHKIKMEFSDVYMHSTRIANFIKQNEELYELFMKYWKTAMLEEKSAFLKAIEKTIPKYRQWDKYGRQYYFNVSEITAKFERWFEDWDTPKTRPLKDLVKNEIKERTNWLIAIRYITKTINGEQIDFQGEYGIEGTSIKAFARTLIKRDKELSDKIKGKILWYIGRSARDAASFSDKDLKKYDIKVLKGGQDRLVDDPWPNSIFFHEVIVYIYDTEGRLLLTRNNDATEQDDLEIFIRIKDNLLDDNKLSAEDIAERILYEDFRLQANRDSFVQLDTEYLKDPVNNRRNRFHKRTQLIYPAASDELRRMQEYYNKRKFDALWLISVDHLDDFKRDHGDVLGGSKDIYESVKSKVFKQIDKNVFEPKRKQQEADELEQYRQKLFPEWEIRESIIQDIKAKVAVSLTPDDTIKGKGAKIKSWLLNRIREDASLLDILNPFSNKNLAEIWEVSEQSVRAIMSQLFLSYPSKRDLGWKRHAFPDQVYTFDDYVKSKGDNRQYDYLISYYAEKFGVEPMSYEEAKAVYEKADEEQKEGNKKSKKTLEEIDQTHPAIREYIAPRVARQLRLGSDVIEPLVDALVYETYHGVYDLDEIFKLLNMGSQDRKFVRARWFTQLPINPDEVRSKFIKEGIIKDDEAALISLEDFKDLLPEYFVENSDNPYELNRNFYHTYGVRSLRGQFYQGVYQLRKTLINEKTHSLSRYLELNAPEQNFEDFGFDESDILRIKLIGRKLGLWTFYFDQESLAITEFRISEDMYNKHIVMYEDMDQFMMQIAKSIFNVFSIDTAGDELIPFANFVYETSPIDQLWYALEEDGHIRDKSNWKFNFAALILAVRIAIKHRITSVEAIIELQKYLETTNEEDLDADTLITLGTLGLSEYAKNVKYDETNRKVLKQFSYADAAALEEAPGGIDLTPQAWDLDTVGAEGQNCADDEPDSGCIRLNFPPEQIEQMRNSIDGFVPVIINFQPITNLPLFLGLKDTEMPQPVEIKEELAVLRE